MGHSLPARAGAEVLGSLMTYCLAVGGVANALLPRTKGEGALPTAHSTSWPAQLSKGIRAPVPKAWGLAGAARKLAPTGWR